VSATAHAAESDGVASDGDVRVESLDIDFSRPHGKRFGTLVHTVLSVVPLDSDEAEIVKVARIQGRVLGANDYEVTAAVEIVERALNHPLIKRAAAAVTAGYCRREVPITMKLENGSIVEGIVDLAFRDPESPDLWKVIDFKTDFEVKGRIEEYRHQVSLYARAIAQSTGLPTEAVLFRI
jgi:ATP-dependent exoDNAse (exonuclease V) beta subunit